MKAVRRQISKAHEDQNRPAAGQKLTTIESVGSLLILLVARCRNLVVEAGFARAYQSRGRKICAGHLW